jgi:hypothetical protein
MSDPDPLVPLSDVDLDRIVEGELSPAEWRTALDRLEREPDGWKRCALAFLEAQCWRDSFRAMESHAPTVTDGSSLPRAPSPLRSGRWPLGWRRVAMAAGIAALFFALGWRAHPDRAPRRGPGESPALATVKPPPHTDVAETGDLPDSIERPSGPTRDVLSQPAPTPPVVTVGRFRVGPSEDGPAVPILAGPGIDEQWVRNQPSPLTEHQQALLEQHGFQVDRRRRLISGTLADGRRVTVPVDQVQLRFTGIDPL